MIKNDLKANFARQLEFQPFQYCDEDAFIFATNKTASHSRSFAALIANVNKPCYFLPFSPRPKVSPRRCIRCDGKVTRYFTLFFELDSFPLAIITTSFGPCLETDGDGKEGGNPRCSGGMSLFIQAFALPSELLAEEVSLVFRPRSSC